MQLQPPATESNRYNRQGSDTLPLHLNYTLALGLLIESVANTLAFHLVWSGHKHGTPGMRHITTLSTPRESTQHYFAFVFFAPLPPFAAAAPPLRFAPAAALLLPPSSSSAPAPAAASSTSTAGSNRGSLDTLSHGSVFRVVGFGCECRSGVEWSGRVAYTEGAGVRGRVSRKSRRDRAAQLCDA